MLGCKAKWGGGGGGGGCCVTYSGTASAVKKTGGKLFPFCRVNIQDQNITEQW